MNALAVVLMFLIYLAVVAYVLLLASRLVNAHERIASSVSLLAQAKTGARDEKGLEPIAGE